MLSFHGRTSQDWRRSHEKGKIQAPASWADRVALPGKRVEWAESTQIYCYTHSASILRSPSCFANPGLLASA